MFFWRLEGSSSLEDSPYGEVTTDVAYTAAIQTCKVFCPRSPVYLQNEPLCGDEVDGKGEHNVTNTYHTRPVGVRD